MDPVARFVTSITLDADSSLDQCRIRLRPGLPSTGRDSERRAVRGEVGETCSDGVAPSATTETDGGTERERRHDADVRLSSLQEYVSSCLLGAGTAPRLPTYLRRAVETSGGGEVNHDTLECDVGRKHTVIGQDEADRVLDGPHDPACSDHVATCPDVLGYEPRRTRWEKPVIKVLSVDDDGSSGRDDDDDVNEVADPEPGDFIFIRGRLPPEVVSNSGYIWQISPESKDVSHENILQNSPDAKQRMRQPPSRSRDRLAPGSRDQRWTRSHDLHSLSCGSPEACHHQLRKQRVTWPPFQPITEVSEIDDDDDDDDEDDGDIMIDDVFENRIFLGDNPEVTSEHGQSVEDAAESVAMEQKLNSYHVYLASSKALLDLQTDVTSLNTDHVILTDSKDDTNQQDSRYNLVQTMLRREKLYIECLRSILDMYAEPLRKFSSLSASDHRLLFCSLEPILSFSTMLCLKLNDAIQTWDPGTTRIGNLFSKQFWHHYDEYYFQFPAIRRLLKYKYETDEEFMEFCRLRHGAAHHSLESLLLLPVQRISDYNSFLSRLLLTTDPEHPDYDDLKKALDRVEMMVKDREKQLQNVENEQKMDTVQDRFPNDDLHLQEKDKKSKNPVKRRATAGAVLLKSLSKKHNHQSEKNVPCSSAPSGGDPATIVYNLPTFDSTTKRVYVLESPVQLTAACQSLDRYLFLFNDILLVAKQRSSSVYKLKQRVRVGEIWLASCISEVAESCRPHDRSIVIGWPTINYVATFGSPELMSIWKEKLTKLIAEEKEKEDKTCIIKICYTAPGGCHASKTLSVTNTEDASSVVNRCIDEFHIQNTDQQEYQLWSVCPGKEDPPYPLFGHEIPYAIRKNHEREWGHRDPGQAEETIDSLRGLDLSYFTLQPAKKKPRDLSLEDPRKGKKVKRSPLHGIFRRNQKTTVLPPSGCLFGRSLDELCDGDKLPEPILVILKVLFVQGQYTVGVFRKPGNHKKCQDVKTKLDNGETVTEDELTVPVAASLFKDFLMSLPNCLLGSQLFDDWLATANLTEASQKEQRINLCKRYVSSLSRGQQTLLRHLMCVLHTIACLQMDKDQGMDAYGLAVCIGQSMLWPSPSNSSSMSDALSKVPLVVQFLIENCEQIFGASSLKLFGKLTQEVKPPQDSSTDSESLHSLPSSLPEQQYVNVRDNSSLDSLERDCYYPEMDSSPQLAKSHLSPTNLSRDSGLTLSDTQLYEDCGDVELSTVTTRKTSYVRSYSQSEDQQPSADPGTLSRSQDADLLHHGGFPVPPPRKPKRRSAGPEFENAMPLQAMRNCGSTGVIGDHKKHYWNAPNPRRISDDSTLGSLDEEYPEDQHTLYLDQYRGGLDIGTLTKSESGAHLYLNDTDLIDHEDDLHQCSPSSHQKSKTSLVLGDHQRRSVLQKLGGSLDLQHPVVTAVKDNVPFGGCKTGISSEGQSSLPSSKALSDLASQNPNNTDSHSSDSTICSMNNDLSGSGSRSCKANDLPFQKTSFNSVKVLSQDVPSTSQVQPHNKSASSVASMSVERSRRAKLKRSDAIDTTTLRKGMTPSGEDKFPTKIPLRTSLYRLEDDGGATSFRQDNTSGEAKSTEQCSTSSQQACLTRRTPGSCKRSDSCSGLAPAVVRSLQQGAIEKSASDTTISEQFELSGPVRATARRRPSNPPSYEEAIQRQSQLGRKLHLSEQDIAIQQKNSAKAKKLYEESLKKYETSEVPGCCPPHRENQIRDRARDVRCPGNHGDSEQTGGPRQPPPYKQACRRAARQQEQNKHQTLHHQTNSGRCESSQQQHRVDLPSKQCDIGPTGEQSLNTNTELGLRCSPQSVTRYSPSQLGGHAELEQPRVELSAKDQRTAHHPIQDNLSIQHTESINDHRDSRVHQDTARAPRAGSPAPQAGSPAPQAGSSAPQIGSPAPQSSSAGLQNHLPVHYSSSASHHTSSPVHHINSVAHHKGSPIHCASSAVWRRESAEQSRPSRAACQMNSVHATQEGHKSPSSASSQESTRSERTAANSQNNRQKHNTVQPERTQNKQSEICSKPDQVVESSKQSAGREKVSSDNPASHSNSSQDLGSTGQDRSRQVRQEGRRRSSSRSRERRSDPKMSSTKSTLITNLGRSKSDSQDHVDKVNRFKTFRAYENNKENISLEDLQADDVIGDYRHGGDQKASRDHTRSQGEESSQRRVVQNLSVLRTAGDQHQNGNGVKTTRRLSVPSSVRNRDWHKELASQYTETFFQPDKPAEAPSKVIQFGYMSPAGTCPKSADKSRPRWTPPVHPTKDLIYITKDDIHATDARQSRSAAAQAVKRRGCRSKSQERPISLISDDFQKLRQLAHGRTSESQPQNDNLGDVRNKMADVRTADDATPTTADDESGVDWSVARLRKLYVGDKVQKERANLTARANGGSNGHFYTPGSRPPAAMLRRDDRLNEDSGHGKCYTRRRYVNEKTNPDANEDYI